MFFVVTVFVPGLYSFDFHLNLGFLEYSLVSRLTLYTITNLDTLPLTVSQLADLFFNILSGVNWFSSNDNLCLCHAVLHVLSEINVGQKHYRPYTIDFGTG